VLGLVAALLIVASASGLLYLVRPHVAGVPGPRVHDALPLDELPHHDWVPLLVFAVTWLAAGALLGLLASALRVERLTAALLLALLTGAWLFATTGVSILVVRQIPSGEAFEAAGRVQAVYLAAALAGAGGALLGTELRRATRHVSAAAAVFVAASGILDVASAVTPAIDSRLRVIEDATPNVVPRLANALVVPTGIALVLLARGLYRRRRRAWQLTLALVGVAALLHILKGLDYEEAIANVALALALISLRHDFAGRGDPTTRARHLLGPALLYVAVIFGYGIAALWINRTMVDRPLSVAFGAKETAESLVGLNLNGSEHLAGRFGDWWPLSVFLLGILGAFALLWTWLRPWRYRLSRDARRRELAHVLVRAFGIDTLAPFTLRADKSYFFSEDELAFLAYKVVAGVAVVSGDPVGPPESVQAMLPRFLRFARDRDWRVAVLGAGDRYLDLYGELGLRSLYHGDEAIIEVGSFSLEGRPIRKVRQSVSRLQRSGYRVDIRYAGEIDDDLAAALERVAEEWRGGAPQKGYTMELDTLFRLDREEALFVIGLDPDGAPVGFLHFAVSPPSRLLSLSSMPRRRDTPNGLNEWLVVATIEWARAHGFEYVSMNFAPFAAVMAPDDGTAARGLRRLQRGALRALKGHGFQLENLLAFNRKFFPSWQRRYVVYESLGDLPRVGLAGLAAEGYLPLAGTRR
jgi:lysyl-tRNA synthetase, class II